MPATATAVAFRANYDETGWPIPVARDSIPTPERWPQGVLLWLMMKRLEAVERCGTYNLRCRFFADCVEWRVADLPDTGSA